MTWLNIIPWDHPFASATELRQLSILQGGINMIRQARWQSSRMLKIVKDILFPNMANATLFDSNLMGVIVSMAEEVVHVVSVEFIPANIPSNNLHVRSSLNRSSPTTALRHVSSELFLERVSQALSRWVVFVVKVADVVE